MTPVFMIGLSIVGILESPVADGREKRFHRQSKPACNRKGSREMKGFFNRLLRIRLDEDENAFSYQKIPDSVLAQTLGGKGLGTHLLMKESPVGVEALSPDNRFIITVGPVTGTTFWSQSRFAVFAKSPATGGFMESYCGGSLAPRIKGCGVDAVVIEGKAPQLS